MTVVLESWRRYLFEFHGEEIIDRLLRLLSLINGDGGTLVRISDYFMGSSPNDGRLPPNIKDVPHLRDICSYCARLAHQIIIIICGSLAVSVCTKHGNVHNASCNEAHE